MQQANEAITQSVVSGERVGWKRAGFRHSRYRRDATPRAHNIDRGATGSPVANTVLPPNYRDRQQP